MLVRFTISSQHIYIYVTGSEKGGHFVQNANFYHFSNCHHTKAFRPLGFPLALQTLQAFYFTDPMLKATAYLLSRAVSCQSEVLNGRFRTAGSMRAHHAHTGSGRGLEILVSVVKWSKNIHSKFQVCSYHSFKFISVLKPKFGICVKCPLFSDPVTYIHTRSLMHLWYTSTTIVYL